MLVAHATEVSASRNNDFVRKRNVSLQSLCRFWTMSQEQASGRGKRSCASIQDHGCGRNFYPLKIAEKRCKDFKEAIMVSIVLLFEAIHF